MTRGTWGRRTWIVSFLLLFLTGPAVVRAQALYLHATGPVNRSMAGASVAAPLDAMGAMNWNPASISGLAHSELTFGLEGLIADAETASTVPGLGSGETGSESGAVPVPTIGWVNKTTDPRLTFGLAILGVAGFSGNFRADPQNPILAPQRTATSFPLGGFGRVYSEAVFLDIVPTVSYALSDKLAIGISPAVTLAKAELEPMVFAGVNDANGDNVSTYPRGQGSRHTWGGGVNLGIYYVHNCCWRFGMSVKSPRWMEDFRFHTEDELGRPLGARFELDLPMVVSFGTSYAGFEDTVIAVDVRYLDYENTDGFRDAGFDANGRLVGIGYDSIFAVATGIQRRLSETLFARVGYSFNENAVPEENTQFNIASPLYYQHVLSGGLSFQPCWNVAINLSYSYSPESQITGPVTLPPNAPTATPATTVPGASVTSTLSVHAVDVGVTVRY